MSTVSPALSFVVIQDRAIIFSCDTLDEGLAFLEGRGGGVLYRMLCGPRAAASRVHQEKARNTRKTKA